MTSKANTIDLGELQDDLETAEAKLKRAHTVKTNAYNAYVRANVNFAKALVTRDVARDAVRKAADNLTV